MQEFIKLSLLLQRLSMKECQNLWTHMINELDRSFLNNLLFFYFSKKPNQSKDIIVKNQWDNIKKMVTDLINIQKMTNNETKHKLYELPCPLIGEVSSYLSYEEYFQFQRINKPIFVATSSPNKLHKMEINRAMLKHPKWLNKFKFVKNISIEPALLLMNNTTIPKWDNLESLELIGEYITIDQIERLIDSHSFNLPKIKRLKVFYKPQFQDTIEKIFDATTNIKDLDLDFNRENSRRQWQSVYFRRKFPLKLQKLKIMGIDDVRGRIPYMITRFETACLLSLECTGDSISRMKKEQQFDNIRKLCIHHLNTEAIRMLNTKKTPNLRRLLFEFDFCPQPQECSLEFLERQPLKNLRLRNVNDMTIVIVDFDSFTCTKMK